MVELDISDKNISLYMANRQFVYALLAHVYAEEPDETLKVIMCDDHSLEELMLVQDEYSLEIASAYELCLHALKLSPNSLSDLNQEYTRIFVGPETLKASPWELMHTTGKRVLFQPGVLEIRHSYREAGFLPQRYPDVSDDFIGLEYDFMAKLAARANKAYFDGCMAETYRALKQSNSFLKDHILLWVDSLAEAIALNYGNGFYAAMTRIAYLYSKRDFRIVDELLEDFRLSGDC